MTKKNNTEILEVIGL